MAVFYKPAEGADVAGGRTGMVTDKAKLVVALLGLLALFWLALYFEGKGVGKAADAMFDAFQVLFTGTVALYGIESAKHG